MVIAFTPQKALDHLKKALQAIPEWRPYHHRKRDNAMDYLAPAPSFKFLDMGSKMGDHKIEGLTYDSSRNHPCSTLRDRSLCQTSFMKHCMVG